MVRINPYEHTPYVITRLDTARMPGRNTAETRGPDTGAADAFYAQNGHKPTYRAVQVHEADIRDLSPRRKNTEVSDVVASVKEALRISRSPLEIGRASMGLKK